LRMSRDQSISVMRQAMDEHLIVPLKTTTPFRDDTSQYAFAREDEDSVPKSKLPKKGTKDSVSFSDIDPLELARQLAKLELNLFRSLTPLQLLEKEKRHSHPYIITISEWSQRISNWVATEIVMTPNSKQRVSVLSALITVAEHSRQLRNYHAIVEIMNGLTSGPITRLARTWSSLPSKVSAMYKELVKVVEMAKDYGALTSHMDNLQDTAALPYLNVLLDQLDEVDQQNPDKWAHAASTGEELVNFHKLRLFSAVVTRVQTAQTKPFNFRSVPVVQDFLRTGAFVLNGAGLMKHSKFCENLQMV